MVSMLQTLSGVPLRIEQIAAQQIVQVLSQRLTGLNISEEKNSLAEERRPARREEESLRKSTDENGVLHFDIVGELFYRDNSNRAESRVMG